MIISRVNLFYFLLLTIVQGNPENNLDEDREGEKLAVSNSTYFDASTPTNVIALADSFVELPCKVHNLGNKAVSWLREQDGYVRLISFGPHIYVPDTRFNVVHKTTNDWNLRINSVNKRYSGTYRCAIAPETDMLFRTVNLTVTEPKVTIKGELDQYYLVGSDIKLTCEASLPPNIPHSPLWYHNDKMLNWFMDDFYEMHVLTMLNETASRSELTINNATKENSGIYTCSYENARKIVNVHFIEGNPGANSDEVDDSSRSTFTYLRESLDSWFTNMMKESRSIHERANSFIDFISSYFY